ncbi:MAG TPA: glycosyltransferase [Thermomicrobiaceae bacterium]|nr:glycosyltransferase [Thermomicrobiaceae bacterium]
MSQRRVALVHDYLNQNGGAERVVEALHDLYPEAPVYTSIYAPELMPALYRDWDIRTSFMQHLPGIHRHHQPYLPLYPFAFNRFRLNGYDLVLSSSSAWGKGVKVGPGTLHICYCHAPMRFAWDFSGYAERERLGGWQRRALTPMLGWLRQWDRRTAAGVDAFIANSGIIAERIKRYWGRDATVINPPVDLTGLRPAAPDEIEDYFLVLSRLVPYKRIDVVVAAFTALGLPLKVAGDGRARAELERIAGPNVRFLGPVSDEEKAWLLARCQAAIFPGEDDFGIAQVEVQASGRPAIALARGGSLDTVVDGVTGILFEPRSIEGVVEAVRRFQRTAFSVDAIINNARRFSRERFEGEIRAFVDERMARHWESVGRQQPLLPNEAEAPAPWS